VPQGEGSVSGMVFDRNRIFASMQSNGQKRRYLSYSEGDFEVFRPARAIRCPDTVRRL